MSKTKWLMALLALNWAGASWGAPNYFGTWRVSYRIQSVFTDTFTIDGKLSDGTLAGTNEAGETVFGQVNGNLICMADATDAEFADSWCFDWKNKKTAQHVGTFIGDDGKLISMVNKARAAKGGRAPAPIRGERAEGLSHAEREAQKAAESRAVAGGARGSQ
jgi:hypothetical protein